MADEYGYDPNNKRMYRRKRMTETEAETAETREATRGGDMAAAARAAKAQPAPQAETDLSKMSPLQRAAYMNRKKKASPGEAARALAAK